MRMTREQMDTYNKQKLLVEKDLLLGSITALENKATDETRQDNDARILEAKRRLITVYIHLGELQNAVELSLSMDGYRIDELDLMLAALDRDDKETCDCKDVMLTTPQGYVPIPRFAKYARVYSEKYNQWIDVHRCTQCGFTQAASTFQPIKHIDQARLDGVQKSDDEVLNV